MQLYKLILKQAFNLTWKNKWLWVFGFFANLLGSGEAYKFILASPDRAISVRDTLTGIATLLKSGQFSQALNNLGNLASTDMASFGGFLFFSLIAIIIFLIIVYLVIVSEGSLVSAIKQLSQTNKSVSLKGEWQKGKIFFWRVLSINLIIKTALWLIFTIIGLFLLDNSTIITNADFIIFMLVFIIAGVAALTLYFLSIYAVAFAVIKRQKIWSSIGASLQLFKKHWLVSLEMAFLLFVISLVADIVFVGVSFVVVIPFGLLLYLFYLLAIGSGFTIVIISVMAIFTILLTLYTAALTTFQFTSWILLFLELNKRGAQSGLLHLSSIIKTRFGKV